MSDSDDEYGPLESSWGSQKKATEEPGWDSLIDTSIKLGPHGLGAGNLHRRGKNFKPIGEELILAQRLNKPTSKKKKSDSTTTTMNKPQRKFTPPSNQKKSSLPPPTTIRTPVSTNSNWSQASLVDVPFWGNTNTATTTPKETLPKQTSPKFKATPKHDTNRVFSSTPAVKSTESVWEKRIGSRPVVNESWGAVAKDIEPFTNTGWGTSTKVDNFEKESLDSWGELGSDTPVSDWGTFAKEPIHENNNNTTLNNNTIPSSRPSWLSSIPTKESHQQQQYQGRFSNPSKQRYSDNAPVDSRPSNYRSDQPPTLTIAPPPPPENNLLVSINVELSDTLKVSVDIRELDEPRELAKKFGRENHIDAVHILEALQKLFTAQKEMALKKKQLKLQRRVYPNRYSQSRPNNVHTKQSYSSSSFVAPSSPPPFTRKVYY